MGDSTVLLVSCCQGSLDAHIRGVANRLGMPYRYCSSADEVTSVLELESPAVLVVWREQIDGAGLSLVRRACRCPATFVVFIADLVTPETECIAQRSGAVSCMSTGVALESLQEVVARIRSSTIAVLQSAVPKTKEVQLGQGLRLVLPNHTITDGQYESRLPPTPGRLLQCLISNVGQVVPFRTLTQKAWEGRNNVTREALHQQIHILRGVLDIYGVSHWIRCYRGKGYLFDPTGEGISPAAASGRGSLSTSGNL